MSHEHDDDGKARIVRRPTVGTPMTEATGKAILAKLDEINESLFALMLNAMDAAHQSKVDRLVDGEADGANGGAEGLGDGC